MRRGARVCYVRRRAPSFHDMVSERGSDPGGPPGRWRGRGRHRRRHAATTPTSTALVLAMLAVCVAWECVVAIRCRVEVAAWEDYVSLQAAADGLKGGGMEAAGMDAPALRVPSILGARLRGRPGDVGNGGSNAPVPGGGGALQDGRGNGEEEGRREEAWRRNEGGGMAPHRGGHRPAIDHGGGNGAKISGQGDQRCGDRRCGVAMRGAT